MRRTLLTSLALVAAAVGCDSSGTVEGIPVQRTPPEVVFKPDVRITTDNAEDAARAAVRSALDIVQLVDMCANFLRVAQPDPDPEPNPPAEPSVLGALQSQTVAGTLGGTAQFTWDDRDADDEYSSGDRFTITFEDFQDVGIRLTLNGTVVIEDMRIAGQPPRDGNWVVDATLSMPGLQVSIGAAEITIDYQLPFRMVNREITETLDLFLFEDMPYGDLVLKPGSVWSRFEDEDVVLYTVSGAVFSGPLEGIVTYDLTDQEGEFGALFTNPFVVDPISGTLFVRGRGGSRVEVEPNCIVPGVCFSVDLRVDEDAEEPFEATLSTSWDGLLPQ